MDHVKNEMPSKGFAEMLGDLHRFVSFMNMTVRCNAITTGGTACLLHVYDRDGLHENSGEVAEGGGGGGGQGGQLPPQLALKRGRQNDDRGAPAANQIT